MTDAFATESYWFLLDDAVADIRWEDGPGIEDDFDKRLAESGRLPELAGAPVASWVAARLARLTSGLPGRTTDQQVDGGVFHLDFLVFDRDRTQLGSVQIQADWMGVAICCVGPNAGQVLTELTACLLAEPEEVARCRLEVWDPGTGRRHAYGYEGGEYLWGRYSRLQQQGRA
ncbi:MAG TPA: hypothetical protein VH643_36375 [Gemmataceae bacterium]